MDTQDLVFEMGMYKALIPVRYRYCEIHFWFENLPPVDGKPRTRCGLTSYAARLLTDLFRMEWSIQVGTILQPDEPIGEVESTKAASELYAPLAGHVTAVNAEIAADPERVGLDPYAAWLFEVEGEPTQALSAVQYKAFLAAGWDETVKMLKGQV